MVKGAIGLSIIVVVLGLFVAAVSLNFASGGRLGFGASPSRPSQGGQTGEAGAGAFMGVSYATAAELANLEDQHRALASENQSEANQAALGALKIRGSDLTAWASHWLEWCAVAALSAAGEGGSEPFAPPVLAAADQWSIARCGYSTESGWRAPDNGRNRWEFLVNPENGEVIRCSAVLSGGSPGRCFRG